VLLPESSDEGCENTVHISVIGYKAISIWSRRSYTTTCRWTNIRHWSLCPKRCHSFLPATNQHPPKTSALVLNIIKYGAIFFRAYIYIHIYIYTLYIYIYIYTLHIYINIFGVNQGSWCWHSVAAVAVSAFCTVGTQRLKTLLIQDVAHMNTGTTDVVRGCGS
jgi:hypothetical protein